MTTKIASKEADYDPLCPYCEKKLDHVHWRKMKSFMNDEYLVICPKCKKILGVGIAGS